MRGTCCTTIVVTLFGAGCATETARRAEPQAPDRAAHAMTDQERIEASLSTMEDRDRAVMRARLDLVRDLGLSDYEGAASPKPGDVAPDFELMPLRIYDFQLEGEPITEANAAALYEPVRLSAFRDKLPVVLIFGSYT